MRSIIVIMIAIVGGASWALNLGRPIPVNFYSEAGRFRFTFDGPPTVTATDVTTVHGEGTMNTTHWENQNASKTMTVIYLDLPKSQLVDDQLVSTAKGAEQNGDKILSDTPILFGPNQLKARSVVLMNKDKQQWIRLLLLMKDARLYMVSLTGPKDFATGPAADAKLATFELTP